MGRPTMHSPAHTRVLALGVLAHAYEINVFRTLADQPAPQSRQETNRPHVGVLVERLPDRKQQSPETDVVRYRRPPNRTEIDRLEGLENLRPVRRHVRPMLEIPRRTPVEPLVVKTERAGHVRKVVKDPDTLVDDIDTDPISRDYGN